MVNVSRVTKFHDVVLTPRTVGLPVLHKLCQPFSELLKAFLVCGWLLLLHHRYNLIVGSCFIEHFNRKLFIVLGLIVEHIVRNIQLFVHT